jgi:hypothetical protein
MEVRLENMEDVDAPPDEFFKRRMKAKDMRAIREAYFRNRDEERQG